MRVVSLLIVTCVLVIHPIGIGRFSEAQEPNTPMLEPPPKSESYCLFRVTYDPSSRLVNLERIKADLLESTQMYVSVAAEVLGVKPTEIDKARIRSRFLIIPMGELMKEPQSQGYNAPGVMTISVRVVSYDEKLPAEKLLKAIGHLLQSQLREMDDAATNLASMRDTLRTEVEVAEKRLSQKRDRLVALKKLLGLISRESAVAIWQRAKAELQNGELQIRGLGARQKVLERQIAELGKKVGDDAAHDPVVLELAKVVKAREKLLATVRALQVAAGPGGGEDAVANAEGGLAEARAELAKYQRVAAQSAGGERLAELNKRLADTQIDLAEAEARRDLLEEQRKEEDKIRTDSAEVDHLEASIQFEQARYHKLSERLRDAELELKLHRPPTVTVIPQQ